MNKAFFLDRDGTLIYDKKYLSDPDEVELIPGVASAMRRAKELGYSFFILTNQSGISRKYHTMDDVRRVNERMEELLELPRPVFTEVCIAPETADEPSPYRKPSPRFILEMIEKYDLDPGRCYMIGDKRADIMAGVNAGITPVVVETGRDGDPHEFPEVAAYGVGVFHSLRDFVEHLEKKEKGL